MNQKSEANPDQSFWLCRHGNRIDFVDTNWVGDDPHLSVDGVVQAEETGRRLRDEGIRHIFASPFLRTIETAHRIAEVLNLGVNIEYGASEWLNPGWFTQAPKYLSMEEMCRRFPRVNPDYQSMVEPEFPESSDEALERSGRALRALADAFSENLLVVGHGHSVAGMTMGLVGDGVKVSGGLCALVRIVRRGGTYSLELAGDSSHLSHGESHPIEVNREGKSG